MLNKARLKKTGEIIQIAQSDVLGTGGQATVVKVDKFAAKLYHQPDPISEKKVTAMLAGQLSLPISVCAPLDIVLDMSGKFAGFTMPLIPKGNEVVQQLASKSFRNAHPDFHSRFVADLFLNDFDLMQKLHQAGIVIGDNATLRLPLAAPGC